MASTDQKTVASDHTSTTADDEKIVKQEKNEAIAEKIASLANDEDKHDKVEDAQENEVKAELAAAENEKSEDASASAEDASASAEDSLKHDNVDDAQSPAVKKEGDDKETEPAAVEKTDDSVPLKAVVAVADNLKDEEEVIPDSQTTSDGVTELVHDAVKCQQDEPPSTEPPVNETPQESIETYEEKHPKTEDTPEAETVEKSVETIGKSSNAAETVPMTESETEVVKHAELLETSAQKEEKPEHVATEVQGKTEEPEKESLKNSEEAEQPSTVTIVEPSTEAIEKQSDTIEENTTAEILKETTNEKGEPTETGKEKPVVTEVEPTETEKAEPVVTEVDPTESGKAEIVITEVAPTETEKEEPVVAEVEPAETEKAEPVVAEVEPIETAKAELVIAEVEPTETGKEEPVLTEAEPVVAEVEPTETSKVELVVAEVEPTETGKEEPVLTEAEPVVAEVGPTETAKAEQVVAEVEPTETGEHVVTEVEPTDTEKAEPVATEVEHTEPVAAEVEPAQTTKAEPVVAELEENQKEPEKQSKEKGEVEQPNTFSFPQLSAETSDAISVEEKIREPESEAEVLKETNIYEPEPTETEKAEPIVTIVDKNQSEPEKQSFKQEEEVKPETTIGLQTEAESQEQPGDTVEVHPPKDSNVEVVKETNTLELEAILVKEEKPDSLSNEVVEKTREQLQVDEEVGKTIKEVEETNQETDKTEGSLDGTIKDPKDEKTNQEEEETAQVSLNVEAQAAPVNLVEPYPEVEEKKVVEEDGTKETSLIDVTEGVSSKDVASVIENPEQASIDQEAKAGLKEETEHSVPPVVEEKVAVAEYDDKKESEALDAVQVSSRAAEVEIKKTEEQNEAKTATSEAVDNKKVGNADTKVDEISKAVTEPVRETLASKFEEKEEESPETGVEGLKKEHSEEPVKTDVEATKESDSTKTSKDVPKETPAKPVQKQSNNIISKVKQSLVKAKKAITGKSPSSKNVSSEAKGDIKVK